jgi:N-acetylglutamate synthase-like GNAT family acetyltransferase
VVRRERLNPLGVDWRNFLVAEDSAGRLVGIGAVKGHGDGSRELASIATAPDRRGRGVAGAVIRALIEREREVSAGEARPLYLTCRGERTGFYERFGFRAAGEGEMTPYFRRLHRLAAAAVRLLRLNDRMVVMRRD